jgi:hypothetical protein
MALKPSWFVSFVFHFTASCLTSLRKNIKNNTSSKKPSSYILDQLPSSTDFLEPPHTYPDRGEQH